MVGIGAIKYFDLMHSPETFIDFDWEKIMNMQGNSGPYIQYTFARTKSVLKKAKSPHTTYNIPHTNSEEALLLRNLIHFPEIVQESAQNYSPNLLCNYLYNLAQTYNSFYNKHKIIGSENESFRLSLTSATGQVLQTGLNLLGIETPEEM
jgi:arginyl-tRNA synthetase